MANQAIKNGILRALKNVSEYQLPVRTKLVMNIEIIRYAAPTKLYALHDLLKAGIKNLKEMSDFGTQYSLTDYLTEILFPDIHVKEEYELPSDKNHKISDDQIGTPEKFSQVRNLNNLKQPVRKGPNYEGEIGFYERSNEQLTRNASPHVYNQNLCQGLRLISKSSNGIVEWLTDELHG